MKDKEITKSQAYKLWEDWLKKCPVWYLKGRTPTVDLESVQFDFDQYEEDRR